MHSAHCQFCNKEMMLQQSIVYKHDYITCGAQICVDKASVHHGLNDGESPAYGEPKVITVPVVILTTSTPSVLESWELVFPENCPDYVKSLEVIEKLFNDPSFAVQSDGGDWYRVQKEEDYLSSLQGRELNG